MVDLWIDGQLFLVLTLLMLMFSLVIRQVHEVAVLMKLPYLE